MHCDAGRNFTLTSVNGTVCKYHTSYQAQVYDCVVKDETAPFPYGFKPTAVLYRISVSLNALGVGEDLYDYLNSRI